MSTIFFPSSKSRLIIRIIISFTCTYIRHVKKLLSNKWVSKNKYKKPNVKTIMKINLKKCNDKKTKQKNFSTKMFIYVLEEWRNPKKLGAREKRKQLCRITGAKFVLGVCSNLYIMVPNIFTLTSSTRAKNPHHFLQNHPKN